MQEHSLPELLGYEPDGLVRVGVMPTPDMGLCSNRMKLLSPSKSPSAILGRSIIFGSVSLCVHTIYRVPISSYVSNLNCPLAE